MFVKTKRQKRGIRSYITLVVPHLSFFRHNKNTEWDHNHYHSLSPRLSSHKCLSGQKKQKREITFYITLFGRDRDLNQYHSYSPRHSSHKCSSRQICFVKTRWFSVCQMSPQNIYLSRHNDALKKITSHWHDFQFVSALMNQSLVEIQRQKTEDWKLRMTNTKIQKAGK